MIIIKKTHPYTSLHKHCLHSTLAEIKHLVKKTSYLMCVEKRNTNKCVRSQQ